MTSLIRIRDIPGGIHPPEHKDQSLRLPLGSVPLPPQLVVPVSQHIGEPATPVVSVGERVLTGQLIAAANGVFSANIHAPSSGTVIAVEDRMLTHPSGMSDTCIVIETDGKDEWIPLQPCEDYHALDKAALQEKIRLAGVAGLGGAGFPTAVKLNPRSTEVIDTLIINGAECEPYITADDMLMQTRADEIIAGTLMISHLLHEPKDLIIGLEDNKPKALAALQKAAEGTRVQVVEFPTKYPSGGAKQIIQILTGREIPTDHHSAYIGVICLNVGTVAAAWRAVRYGEPLISRITTVVGEALEVQRNVEVRIGTPIDFVLAQHGFDAKKASRLIMGGPMMGFTLPSPSVPVIKTTNCILAPTLKELPPPAPAQACIRCGLCADACPASLLPQQLFWYAQAEDMEKLQAHNLFDCIECGACSYVCPSNIPLVQYYRAAKGSIRQHEQEKEKSDRSRRRFEFRQQRIAKEEAEKEAKRLARKQAAEEAKQKLAEKAAAAAPAPQAEVVAEAVAKARAVQQTPEEQQAKLERILAAARNSLEHAQQPLVPNEEGAVITQEQLEKQQARIKQAELKVSEAEKKLADFMATQNNSTAAPADTPAPANDPVAAAIARAQAKLSMSPEEKLRSTLESLRTRLAKAQEKANAAKAEGSPTADALQQGVEKLQQKIADTEAELAQLAPAAGEANAPSAEQHAAEAAIEKAKAKAAALATMSEEEKRAEQLKSVETRLQKARERLAKAEADNDPNIEAFRNGVVKLEEKHRELQDA
ncbi:MAG: electron transport complex subunit RsxC [Cellvibrio sp.]